MNILCIDQYASFGGAQRTLLDLLPSFAPNGWNATVTLPDDGPFAAAVRQLRLPVEVYRAGLYSKVKKGARESLQYFVACPGQTRTFLEIIRSRSIQLLYVNGPRPLPAAALASRLACIPIVFHCHHRLTQRAAIHLTGSALRLSRARVVACCKFTLDPLRCYLDGSRVQVIYNGVGPSGIERRPWCEGSTRIGVVGRIEEEKGQLIFVRAAKLLCKQFEHLQFTVVGSPLFSDGQYFDQVRSEARGLPVSFPGWSDSVAETYDSVDLLVVPSLADATPRVVIEAWAACIPVVAFRTGGIPELVRDMDTGFLASDTTPESLAGRIASVLRMDPQKVRNICAKARDLWRGKYTLDRCQEEIGKVIRKSLEAA